MNATALPTHPFGTTSSAVDRGWRFRLHQSSSATMIERTAEPGWVHAARANLEGLVNLPRGWDGYDAEPLSRSAAQDALTFLEATLGDAMQLPAMTPIHGGIQLEWHAGSADVEVELRPDAWNGYIRDAGDEWEGDVRAEPERLRAGLQRIAAPPGA
jgi:hypothetical protein